MKKKLLAAAVVSGGCSQSSDDSGSKQKNESSSKTKNESSSEDNIENKTSNAADIISNSEKLSDSKLLQPYMAYEKYINDTVFTHFAEHFNEVNGKTWGIIGLGTIGRRVADIAKAFGAHVIYYSASGSPAQEGYEQVDFETLLATSDIVSVHAPLNEYTKDLMDREAFEKMKKTAIFLNLGRGPIVVEQDLYEALETGEIAAAGLDVLCEEPMSETNPLAKIKDSKKLIITPHIAWASVEARNRLMQIIVEQIREFL